ncbi:MAG: S53 family peptidase [Thaumarchaeota archaeon]|nr:S53 family peptidase [Nitrososphaerota archaeon]
MKRGVHYLTNKLPMHGLLLALLIIPLPIGAINEQSPQFTPLYSQPALTDATPVGLLDPGAEVTLLLTLRPRYPDLLNSFVKDLSDPNSPNYRRYLTPSEFSERFSPSAESYQDLAGFFEAANLTVTRYDNRLVLTVKGGVSQFERLLGVEFRLYLNSNNETVYSVISSPKLPYRFAPLVYGVAGLNNATVMRAPHQFAPMGQAGQPPFNPQQIRSAYGVTSLLDRDVDGSGQNITIVVAYGSPTLSSDLTVFANQYSVKRTHGTIYYPSGQPRTQNSGWAKETTLDVTWASVMAPGATINVVVSPTPDQTLWGAVNYAVSKNLGKIISLSWGDNESPDDEMYEPILQQAVAQGISVFVSSGDCGAFATTSAGCSQTQRIVSYPASSPNVIAVGGTTLTLDSQNRYQSETAWSKSGGGVSNIFSRPWWQQGNGLPASTLRSIPDISMVGDPKTGVPIYVSGQWISSMGGTSLSAPLAAGAYALANNLIGSRLTNSSASNPNLGFAAPLIYTFARSSNYSSIIHDTVSGSNGYYQTGQGWDSVTGWGSLNVDPLSVGFASQLKRVSITSPTTGATAIPITVDGVSYTVPTTLWFVSGSAHTFGTKQVVTGSNGTRYLFSDWTGSISTSEPEKLIQITGNTSLILNYKAQYLLSVTGAAGELGGWFDAGATAQIQVPVSKDLVAGASRQNLISWQQDGKATSVQRAGAGNITSKIVMNTSHTVTFNYVPQYYLKITGGYNTKSSNSQTNDGWFDAGSTAKASSDYVWNVSSGESRSNLVSLQQDGGAIIPVTGRSSSGTFTTPDVVMDKTHTIQFNGVTQYYLTVSGGSDIRYSAGSPTGDDWFDKGTDMQILSSYTWGEKPNQSRQNLITYTLDGQTGSLPREANGSAGPTVIFNNHHTLTFNSVTQYPLTIIGGSNTAATGSKTRDNWFDDGAGTKAETDYTSSNTAAAAGAAKERKNLISWKLEDEATTNPVSRSPTGRFATPLIVMNKPRTVTFNTITQYPVKITGGGNTKFSSASPTQDEWFDSGQSTSVITDQVWNVAKGRSRNQLVAWQLDKSEKTNIERSQSGQFTTPAVKIDASRTITFLDITQYWLAVDPSGGSVDKASQWLDKGSTVTITATSPSTVIANRSRLLFTGWSGSDPASNTSISVTMDTFKSYAANWKPQYYVQVITPIGSATGEGWYNSGSVATVKITPTTQGILIQQAFAGWTGSLTSKDPEAKLVVNSSAVITAEWSTDYTQLILALTTAGIAGTGALLAFRKRKPDGGAVSLSSTLQQTP